MIKLEMSFTKVRNAHKTENTEDYLELIAELLNSKGEARIVDIAESLGIAQATANKTIQRLQSEGYIKRLQSEDRPTAVDLIYDNRMLGALTPSMVKKTGKHKVTLAFTRKEEIDKAFFNQVTNEPQREFFGFNTKTEKIINKAFNKFVEKELRNFKI